MDECAVGPGLGRTRRVPAITDGVCTSERRDDWYLGGAITLHDIRRHTVVERSVIERKTLHLVEIRLRRRGDLRPKELRGHVNELFTWVGNRHSKIRHSLSRRNFIRDRRRGSEKICVTRIPEVGIWRRLTQSIISCRGTLGRLRNVDRRTVPLRGVHVAHHIVERTVLQHQYNQMPNQFHPHRFVSERISYSKDYWR